METENGKSNKQLGSLKYTNTTLSLLTCLLISFQAYTQETWTLDKCIEYGLTHNSDYISSRAEEQRSEQKIIRSKGAFYPSVGASAEHTFHTGELNTYEASEESGYQTGNAGIVAEADLFTGFRRKYQLKADLFEQSQSLNAIEIIKNQLALDIADAFMQVLYSNENKQSTQNQIDITKTELTKIEAQVNAGTKTKADLLRMQAQLESERAELISLEGSEKIARLQLMQFMEYQPDSAQQNTIILDTSIVSNQIPDLLNIDSLQAAALLLPEMEYAQNGLNAAEQKIGIQKSYYSPQLKVRAYYGTQYLSYDSSPSIGAQFGDHLDGSIGLHLYIPIFNRYQTSTAVAESKIDLLQAEKNVVETEKQLRFSTLSAYQDAITSRQRYEVEQKSTEFYRESFRFAQAQLEAGTITALDFNTEKSALSSAETRLIQSRYQMLYQTLRLNYIITGQVSF